MLEDWNKGVGCVGQSVQDLEVGNVENDDDIEADNNQDCKWILLFAPGTNRLVPVPEVWYRYRSIGSEIQEIKLLQKLL